MKKINIIDKEQHVADLLKLYLDKQYKVYSFPSFHSFVSQSKGNQNWIPDLALCDLELNHDWACEKIPQLAKEPMYKHIRFVNLIGKYKTEIQSKNCTNYLKKDIVGCNKTTDYVRKGNLYELVESIIGK
jgi:hypothetical protein